MSDTQKQMERYLAGEMSPDERVTFEDAVLANEALANQLYADTNIRALIETSARARRERTVLAASANPWWRRRFIRWMVPTIAMATVLTFVFIRTTETPDQPPVFRSNTSEIQVIAPAGEVASPPTLFLWRAAPNAAFYRFELFDASSVSVFQFVTSDTTATLDPAAINVPSSGYWTITPLNDLRVSAGDAVTTRFNTTR